MSAEQTKSNRNSVPSFTVVRRLRISVAVAWTAGSFSVALLLVERQFQVIHLFAIPFIILLVVSFGAALGVVFRGFWQLLRGPRRFAAMTWVVLGVLPPLFWVALGWYGHRQWASRNVPHNLAMALVRMAGTSLMEAQASYLYPHRLETDRIVMFYGDGVTEPQADIEAMDQHVARLEEMRGSSRRAKIWWIRGTLLGQGPLAIRGLALGSSKSPVGHSDRHELAHAVMYQGEYPDTDPPTLLVEGWAEAQSVDSNTLARLAAYWRRYLAENGEWWEAIKRDRKLDTVPDPEGLERLFGKVSHEGRIDSYLDELTDPFWYHHDAGVVYSIGGAFVEFLLRRYGRQRFMNLYFSIRPGTFKIDCETIYGLDLDALETLFWDDVEQRKSKPPS